jgi:hypothetical protein
LKDFNPVFLIGRETTAAGSLICLACGMVVICVCAGAAITPVIVGVIRPPSTFFFGLHLLEDLPN